MNKIIEKTPLKKITLDIPIALYKELHIVLVHKYDSIYGHLREALIEGLEMWLKKQKATA